MRAPEVELVWLDYNLETDTHSLVIWLTGGRSTSVLLTEEQAMAMKTKPPGNPEK